MNPAAWLWRTAIRVPAAPALLHGTRTVADYTEFARRAGAVAGALAARGIGRGARVALFMANHTAYLEAMYGIWWAGAAVVPINAKLHEKEAAWICDNADVALVFGDDKSAGLLGSLLPAGCAMISVEAAAFEAMRAGPALPLPVSLDADDLAWLFYTSGTTGRPKGVMMSAGNLAAMTLCYFVDVDEVRAEDAILYAAPMSHGAGIYNFMHVMRGARHVVPASGGFDAGEILDIAPMIGPVSMFAAPTMVRRLVDAAKRTGSTGEGIRTIVYGGGPMYQADILEAVTVLGPRFVQIYGQGECPMGISALSRHDVADRSHPRWQVRLNSVGTAQSLVQVAILDAGGRELPPGETGEIAVRGQTVMQGYWRNPEATARTLRDGWLWTGDMGWLDADGYLTMQDRSKDMIISGGSNIYPREVEEVLLRHPGVHEVAVVGQPDAEWGELVVAFVVRQPEAVFDETALDRLCLDSIARFKRPKAYRFVEALPKNNYGKVLKTELRAWLQQEEPT